MINPDTFVIRIKEENGFRHLIKRDILIELELPVPKTPEELEKERKAKESEENAD